MGESTTEITLIVSAKVGPGTDQGKSRHHSADLSICLPSSTLASHWGTLREVVYGDLWQGGGSWGTPAREAIHGDLLKADRVWFIYT